MIKIKMQKKPNNVFLCPAQLQNPSIGRTYLIQPPYNQILQH